MTRKDDKNDETAMQDAHDLDGLLIDFADLRPGDILLFRPNATKLHQRKIEEATGSPYTHAAIYVGENDIVEAVPIPPKVRKRSLTNKDKQENVIGVLRTQAVFSDRRVAILQEFLESLTNKFTPYDFSALRGFEERKEKFHLELQAKLEKDFGQVTAKEEFIQRSYFCSALVVVCYTVTDIIDHTAQIVYNPDVISPGGLHSDTSFGWFLGYIVSDPSKIPANDPLLKITDWRGQDRWW